MNSKRIIILLFLAFSMASACKNAKNITEEKVKPLAAFDFGPGQVKEGYYSITENSLYSAEKGFGLVSDKPLRAYDRNGSNTLLCDFITSDSPFYFVIDLPEGNYRVNLHLGDYKGQSLTTVKAESRRLMLENIMTENGNVVSKSFDINVRTPSINDTLSIRLKSRETNYLNWDNKLTIEFNGKRPCVAGIEIYPLDSVPVIFLAGNSTVTDQEEEP